MSRLLSLLTFIVNRQMNDPYDAYMDIIVKQIRNNVQEQRTCQALN